MDAPKPCRRRRSGARVVVLALLALGVAGCGGGDDGSASPTTTAAPGPSSTSPPAGERRWPECRHGGGAFTVAHPPGWRTNDGSVLPTCTLFDPAPIDVPPASEIPFGIAVAITVEPVAAARIVGADDPGHVVLARRTERVAGRRATRIETEATGDSALVPPGTRQTRWIVPVGAERSIVARSTDIGAPGYDEKQHVLDRMVRSLEVHDDRADEGAGRVGPGGREEVGSPGSPAGGGAIALLATRVPIAATDAPGAAPARRRPPARAPGAPGGPRTIPAWPSS